jgi:predicted double-glycine peptidase
VKVFQTVDKDNDVRYYVYFHPDEHKCRSFSRAQFEKAHREHWQIEVFHRTSKQVCNIEHFFVRTSSSIKTHLFAALRAFIRLTAMVKGPILGFLLRFASSTLFAAQREFILNFA